MARNWKKFGNFVALAAFGAGYNQMVDVLEETGNDEQITSLLVAFGVAVTLMLSIPLVGKRATKQLFFAFAASGTPMILGHLWRYRRRAILAKQK